MMFRGVLLVILVVVCFVAAAEQADNAPNQTGAAAYADNLRLQQIENGLKEVRRDQLNYSIEKDLLKETYASNLQTINSVITLVLGTFSILAFFGIRSIGSIRQDFHKELQTLRDVREKSERRLREIEYQQARAKERLDQIADANVKQDVRLKVLELIESSSSAIRLGNFSHALEYIAIGIEMDSENVQLHKHKEHCLLKLRRFEEAAEVQEKLLNIDANDYDAALNLCEISLLLGNEDRYLDLSKKYSSAISKRDHLGWFFESVRLYMSQDDQALKKHIDELSASLPSEKKKYLAWEFSDCKTYINEHCKREIASYLFGAYSVLEGKLFPKDLNSEAGGEDNNS